MRCWKSLKLCLIDSNCRPLPRSSHHVTVSGILPPFGFFQFLKKLFLKRQNRTGREGWKGRVVRVQETGEAVETVLGMWDVIQVNSSFHLDVKSCNTQHSMFGSVMHITSCLGTLDSLSTSSSCDSLNVFTILAYPCRCVIGSHVSPVLLVKTICSRIRWSEPSF